MPTPHYPEVTPNPDFAELEQNILQFWAENKVFEKSVQARAKETGGESNQYIFYDGPPFANGLPHYGHLLTGYVKDAIARYHTMKGKRVERRFGWDCHGLPAEMGSEKELGITGRNAIIEFGIDKFNEHCRTSVMKYVHDWRYYVTRQGRWVDFDDDYKTLDTNYMESVVWAFSELYKKGLVYESFRVMPYSWAAETPLSNFETRMDNATREREDKAAYVKFKLREKPEGAPDAENYYIIAWTTTPWTLPSNLALAVNREMKYACVIKDDECLILAQSAVDKLSRDIGTKLEKEVMGVTVNVLLTGDVLINHSYEPLFPYFADTKNAFRVIDGGDAVTEGEGTGVIHMAPGFGEVDQRVCAENGIEVIVPVDEKGRYTAEIFDLPDLKLQGLNVIADTRLEESDKAQHIAEKDVAKYGLANMRIVRWLKAHGALVKDEPYKHNYPHCWRTDTPIIYRAMSSWYVAVTKFRDRAVELNQQINWIPSHVRDGQMGHMLATAPDWSISRNRFWGTPIPIWRSPSGKLIVPGSIAEIEQLSGKKVPDLHRPYIDTITFERDGETYTRVEDVFDCWFESGSMPYAQLHYPFENKKLFEENFPADFITEYVGQTRGWFNTLIMLSTALFDKPPFKNCICHGVVIDAESGLKYSKRLKNYKDPKEVMDNYGADALRWMMLASPVMRGMDIGVDPEGKFIRDVVRLNIKPLWSAYNFFTLYANADGVKANDVTSSDNMLDRYILAKCKASVLKVQASMDAYDTPGATEAITQFFDVLNNWYIRRSRARFWGSQVTPDKQSAYDTLFTVLNLMVKATAPLLPFVSEAIYRGLNGEKESVHLQNFPDVSKLDSAEQLIIDMDWARDICNTGSAIRNRQNIRNRQPLAFLGVYGAIPILTRWFAKNDQKDAVLWEYLRDIIKEELNVKELEGFTQPEDFDKVASRKLSINSQVLGKRLPAKMKEILPASKKNEWKYADDKSGILIAGELLEANAGEYSIILEPKAEYKDSAHPSSDNVVVLDLTITPELEAEGRARDLVRMIQQSRKDAGLDVSDRIALNVDVPVEFRPVLAGELGDYIKEQTLAVSLAEGSAKAEQQMKQELDGAQFIIGISKAA
jgi:isoleucyl-tRNA synthetase